MKRLPVLYYGKFACLSFSVKCPLLNSSNNTFVDFLFLSDKIIPFSSTVLYLRLIYVHTKFAWEKGKP